MDSIPFDRSASRRISTTLFISQSFFSVAFISMVTLLSLIAKDLSGGAAAVGLPNTMSIASGAVMAYPVGMMMHRYGRRFGHVFGYFMMSIGAMIGVLAMVQGSFALLLLGTAFIGAGRPGAEQTRFSVAEVYPTQERASVIGMLLFAGTLGSLGAPLLVPRVNTFGASMGLPDRAGAWIPAAVLLMIAALITFVRLRPDPREIGQQIRMMEDEHRRTTSPGYKVRPARSLREIFRDPGVQLALAAALIAQTVMICIMLITPVHMEAHDFGDEPISIVFMAHTLGMFAISPFAGRLVDHFGRVNMILSGAVILIMAVAIAPLSAQLPVLIVALFLLGLGWNFCFIGGTSLFSDCLTPEERGRAQGVNEALVAAAAGIGSLSSGILFDVGGYLGVSIIGLLLTLVLTGLIGSYKPPLPEISGTQIAG